jgi:endoglucanase
MPRPLSSLAPILAAAFLACIPTATSPGASPPPPSPPPPPLPALTPAQSGAILRARGTSIVDGAGHDVVLRGAAFGNEVWSNVRIPRNHHGEADFARLEALGMNAVRFYLNYRTFESDAEPGKYLDDGFRWLDENVAWARRHGVYLIFNLHVPQGGYQSLGKGSALWDDPGTRTRFIGVWRAIAARYRGEPVVAGYDLLNEPVVTRSIDQWRELAGRTAGAIREVDPEHLLFVERVNSVGDQWKEDADRNFFRIADANVVYEFHFYKPFTFTHQGASWVENTPEEARYPDPSVAEVEWFLLTAVARADQGPKLPAGDSDWTFYPGSVFTVTDPAIVVGKPVLTAHRLGAGRAFFDDLVLEEVDAQGTPKRTIWRQNPRSRRGWYFWKAEAGGSVDMASPGHGDEAALAVTGTRGYANLGADSLRFRTEPGASYRLSGWMRGEHVPAEATARIELEFSSSRVPVQARDKAFVAQELNAYLAWGKKQQVPLFLGEWGAIRQSFEGDHGGIRWVSDMLDLLLERGVSFTYHAYHESSFGMFSGDGALPDPGNANGALLDLFKARLRPL